MRDIRFLIMGILLLSMASCSTGDNEDEQEGVGEVVAAEMDEEFEVEGEEGVAIEEMADEMDESEGFVSQEEIKEEVISTAVEAESQAVSIMQNGKYRVKKNDTLMWIAFRLYGDYSRWRELQNINGGISPKGLSEGTIIQYRIPNRPFVWNPKGNPYLIKRGDTLGIISTDVYGKQERWREIYDNNRPMIKDPNLIFAGFTLYYIPDRDLASE